jgi:hypothetical protein
MTAKNKIEKIQKPFCAFNIYFFFKRCFSVVPKKRALNFFFWSLVVASFLYRRSWLTIHVHLLSQRLLYHLTLHGECEGYLHLVISHSSLSTAILTSFPRILAGCFVAHNQGSSLHSTQQHQQIQAARSLFQYRFFKHPPTSLTKMGSEREGALVAPLVTLETQPDGTHKFRKPQQNVRDFLNPIRKSVCPVAAAGDMRMGKSTLMNILLRMATNKNNVNAQIGKRGFQTGATTDAVTKGVWLALQEVPISETLTMLLLDTEGLNSTDVNQEYDIKLFGFVIAITQLIILNIMKKVQSTDISVLALAGGASKKMMSKRRSSTPKKRRRDLEGVSCGEEPGTTALSDDARAAYMDDDIASPHHMRAAAASPSDDLSSRSTDDDEEEEDQKEFGKIAPHLMVLIRDALELCHPHTKQKNISPNSYLEGHLDPAPVKMSVEKHKRQAIRNVFPHRHCYTMPVPTSDKDIEKNVSAVPDNLLNKDFVVAKNKFVDLLMKIIQPKMIMGRELDGPGFLNLVDSLVDTMNNNSDLIVIHDVFAASAQLTCQNLYNELLQQWEKEPEESFKRQQRALNNGTNARDKFKDIVEPEILQKRLSRHIAEYMALYRKRAADTAFAEDIAAKLEAEFCRRRDYIIQLNQTLLSSYVQSHAFKFQSSIQTECKTMAQFQEKYTEMKKVLEESVGKSAMHLLQEYLSVDKIIQMLNNIFGKEIQESERQGKQMKSLMEEHEVLRTRCEKLQQIADEKDRCIAKLREDFAVQEEKMADELNRLKTEKSEISTSTSEQLEYLTNELDDARDKINSLNNDILEKIETHALEIMEKERTLEENSTRLKELERFQAEARESTADLQEKNELLQEQMKLTESYKFQLDSVTSRIEAKERELENVVKISEGHKQSLEMQNDVLRRYDATINQLDIEKDALLSQLSVLEEEKSTMAREHAAQFQELREKSELIQNQLAKMTERVHEGDAMIVKVKDDLSEQNKAHRLAGAEHLEQMRKVYDDLKQETSRCKQVEKQFEREKVDMERKHAQEMKKSELDLNSLKSTFVAQKETLLSVTDELKKVKEDVTEARKENSRQRTTNARDNNELSALRSQKQAKEQEFIKLTALYQDLQREHENLKSSYDTRIMEAKMQARATASGMNSGASRFSGMTPGASTQMR